MLTIWRKARKTAVSIYGPKLAEDIAQEVVVYYLAYEKKHGKTSHQTVEHAVIDSYRRMMGRSRLKDSWPKLVTFDEHHETPPDQNQLPSYDEMRSILTANLHGLTSRQFECAMMTLNGLNQREIALQMNITESAVARLMKYIVRSLKCVTVGPL